MVVQIKGKGGGAGFEAAVRCGGLFRDGWRLSFFEIGMDGETDIYILGRARGVDLKCFFFFSFFFHLSF